MDTCLRSGEPSEERAARGARSYFDTRHTRRHPQALRTPRNDGDTTECRDRNPSVPNASRAPRSTAPPAAGASGAGERGGRGRRSPRRTPSLCRPRCRVPTPGPLACPVTCPVTCQRAPWSHQPRCLCSLAAGARGDTAPDQRSSQTGMLTFTHLSGAVRGRTGSSACGRKVAFGPDGVRGRPGAPHP